MRRSEQNLADQAASIPVRRLWLYVALLILPGGVVVLGVGAMARLLRRRPNNPRPAT